MDVALRGGAGKLLSSAGGGVAALTSARSALRFSSSLIKRARSRTSVHLREDGIGYRQKDKLASIQTASILWRSNAKRIK